MNRLLLILCLALGAQAQTFELGRPQKDGSIPVKFDGQWVMSDGRTTRGCALTKNTPDWCGQPIIIPNRKVQREMLRDYQYHVDHEVRTTMPQ